MVEHYQVGAVFSAFLEHPNECPLLFGAQLPANRIHFEQMKIVVFAKFHKHVGTGFLLFRCVAEAVRPKPHTKPAAK